MAVPEQTPYIEYSANGISKKFSVPFQCLSKNTLIVSIDGVETLPQLWDFNSGEIIFITAPLNNSIVSIKRSTHLKREVSYNSFTNSMLPTVFNGDFDRIWHTLQEQSYKLGQYDFDYSYAVNISNQANQKADQANQKADLALEGLETVSTETQPILRGGTGATTAEDARNNLDVYSQTEVDALIATGGSGNIVGIENGGTGADTAEDARNKLDVYSQTEVDTAIANATPTIPDATVEAKGIVRLADSSDISNNSETVAVSPKDVNAMISGLGVPTSAPRALLAFSSKPKTGTNSNIDKVVTATIANHGLAAGDVINITYSYKTTFSSSTTTGTVTVTSVTNANTFVFNGSGGSSSGSGYACTLHFVIKANTNISAITDLGVGYFRIAMSTALASNNYLVFYEAYDTNNTLKHVRLNGLYTKTATQFEIRVTDNAGLLVDADFIHVGVFL